MSIALSVRELGLRAIVAALGATGSPASGVSRSRLDQIKQTELPCYDITPGEEKLEDEGSYGDHNSVTRTLPVAVRALVDASAQEGSPNSVDDSALDPFYVFAVQQLTGSGSTLGGVVDDVQELSAAVIFQPNGKDLIGLEMQFQITFATKRGDPTQKG